MRGRTLTLTAWGSAAVTAAALVWWLNFVPTTLRVAVAPSSAETGRLLAAVSAELDRRGAPIRLRLLRFEGLEAAASALDEGRVDLAVVRPDRRMPATGLGVATLQQYVMVAFAKAGAEIASFADLRSRRIGVLGPTAGIAEMPQAVRTHFALGTDPSAITAFSTVDELVGALVARTIDAAIAFAPRGGHTIRELAQDLAQALEAPPLVLAMREASLIADRNRGLVSVDLAAGELAQTPALPTEGVTTLAAPAWLVARDRLPSAPVEELTRLLFTLRPALMTQHSDAVRMEPLPTERGGPIAVHPGAATYYDAAERGFLERYSDLLWLAVFGLGAFASIGAGIARWMAPRRAAGADARLAELAALLPRARNGTADERRAIADELDGLVTAIAQDLLSGAIDPDRRAAYELVIARIERVLDGSESAGRPGASAA